MNLYSYEKGSDGANLYFDKIGKLVKKLMSHKWDEKELMAYFLVHCTKNSTIKRELRLRDANDVEQTKEVILKIDSIEREEESIQISAVNRKETFTKIVQKRQQF